MSVLLNLRKEKQKRKKIEKLEKEEDELTIYASHIDLTHIFYICPFILKEVHYHGSSGNLLNRIEYRGGHNNNCSCNNLKIIIGDFTKRTSLNKTGYYWKELKNTTKRLKLIHQFKKKDDIKSRF